MLAHGILESVNDVDILARGAAWQKALELGSFELAKCGDKVIHLDNRIDVFDGWLGLDIDTLFSRATRVEGLPYADLRDVLEYKRCLSRPKDSLHITLLETRLTSLI